MGIHAMGRRLRAGLGVMMLAAGLLAGCATMPPGVASQPPAYQQGYQDGRSSGAGHIYARFAKDTARYLHEPLYRVGWDDGYQRAKANSDAVDRMLGPVW